MARGICTVVILGVALVGGCGPGQPSASSEAGAEQMAPSDAPAIERVPQPHSVRNEAQESFDRARAALVREDYAESARHLEDAAAFMRSHADEAEIGAIAALQGSAKELEVLAQRLAGGEPPTTRALDRVFANANRAEAQHHLTRAIAALSDSDHRRAGEELLWSVDHFERAARDLGRPGDAEAESAYADARALAQHLLQGRAPTRAEAKRATRALEAELRRLCALIDTEARACAVEAAR